MKLRRLVNFRAILDLHTVSFLVKLSTYLCTRFCGLENQWSVNVMGVFTLYISTPRERKIQTAVKGLTYPYFPCCWDGLTSFVKVRSVESRGLEALACLKANSAWILRGLHGPSPRFFIFLSESHTV